MAVLNCRVLKSGKCEISQKFKGATHKGIDLVGAGYTLDYIVAHSAGTVVAVVANCNRNTSKTGERIYGNYVKIRHDDGYYTLYAHLKYGTVAVSNGQRVEKGQVLGYMGNTGYSFGAHLHWEVRNTSDTYIDPTPYLDADLPDNKPVENEIKYIQTWLNNTYNTYLVIDGIYGPATKKALIMGLQTELSKQFGAGLVVDGIFGPATKKACVIVKKEAKGNITKILQSILYCRNFDPNGIDGIFGNGTEKAVKDFQRAKGLTIDGIVGKNTWSSLFA